MRSSSSFSSVSGVVFIILLGIGLGIAYAFHGVSNEIPSAAIAVFAFLVAGLVYSFGVLETRRQLAKGESFALSNRKVRPADRFGTEKISPKMDTRRGDLVSRDFSSKLSRQRYRRLSSEPVHTSAGASPQPRF